MQTEKDPLALTRLRSMAIKIIEESATRTEAAEAIERRVMADSVLFKTLLRPKLDLAIWELIKQLDKPATDVVTKEPTPSTKVVKIEPRQPDPALVAAGRRSMLDMKLFNGSRLGDANRDLLSRAADHHEDRARNESNLGAFYANLLYRVGNRTVAEVFGEQQLSNLATRFGL